MGGGFHSFAKGVSAEVDIIVLWPRKGSLMKTQTRILDNRLYYTRKIELHRKGKKSRTVRITSVLICLLAAKSLVLITVRRVQYGTMKRLPQHIERLEFELAYYDVTVQLVRHNSTKTTSLIFKKKIQV